MPRPSTPRLSSSLSNSPSPQPTSSTREARLDHLGHQEMVEPRIERAPRGFGHGQVAAGS